MVLGLEPIEQLDRAKAFRLKIQRVAQHEK